MLPTSGLPAPSNFLSLRLVAMLRVNRHGFGRCVDGCVQAGMSKNRPTDEGRCATAVVIFSPLGRKCAKSPSLPLASRLGKVRRGASVPCP